MLSYVLYGLFILSCFVLVVAVLLQPGKADAGALFTSSVSSTTFGPRGTQTLLAKITIGAAIAFMLSALLISFNVGGTRSVVAGEPEGPAAPQQQQQQTTTPAPQTNASPAANEQSPANADATQGTSPANTNAATTGANANAAGGNADAARNANTAGAATNAQPAGSPR